MAGLSPLACGPHGLFAPTASPQPLGGRIGPLKQAIYRRLRDKGRGMPDGLRYVNSWIEASLDRCFQLMECDDVRLLQQWVMHWNDLIEFEIVPVAPSSEVREAIESSL